MKFDTSDGLIVAGTGCVFVGLWWLLPAAAMIVGGLLLVALGLLLARKEAR